MELRQLRSFVRVVELSSMGRAALELGIATSTLSQQISQLESELATRLLQRRSTGVFPTEAGLDFWHQAQVILRQVDTAAAVARQGRFSGQVSIGMATTTAAVLTVPLLSIMRERYPAIRVRIVEGLTAHLAALLNSRQLDLALLFEAYDPKRWSVTPLVDERLFVVARKDLAGLPPTLATARSVKVSQIGDLPLIMPGNSHALRDLMTASFNAEKLSPNVVLEIEGAHSLMRAVRAGLGATVQPGAVLSMLAPDGETMADDQLLRAIPIEDPSMRRRCLLASFSDDELSPSALATRVTLVQLARQLVQDGVWRGAIML
ncbi:LysR family transcriptional regulator [Bordetella genomosp. 8]|uniref:LysR family transcriptional regulator n=1 Tax=Bordetella genomosp. 8 TaxID=1416806 RepID=A0A1W6YNE5_9BORD|nr:LysR substrate-binding domain-containing protein [Bordetella genomosp. 8]ARP82541.1 LysR family transcriptional regulator [Bordetella genomosp. 8]